ncbi:hypothetical protein ETH_00013585 [Eimeria tenella]|uniref:Uncharacterized protein n=1 Tax=Eimeria tenella TaxID=5802 RepID=U6KYV6_EIMTE|nr:hypothetical protein ETH_00013585 [Eimeria tenella]CDJ43146.1 hypothetical protein ETH_00013585 [Eimeria tenella]|eukprot:XP_013233896.1 hypothetical protein ETH_00013585 [Eimeria tenella]
MSPEERLEYDRTMADENAAKVDELQSTIEYERKQAGILSPTQRLLLGALAPMVPHVPTA